MVLFLAGLFVGFVTLRYPIDWLLGFGHPYFVEIITADNYFTFVAYFLLAFGLTFELPLVLTGLVVMGIVSPDALRTRRASILVGLWTVSCFITPGADPYSPDPRSGLHRALLRQHGPDPLRRPGIGGEANPDRFCRCSSGY